MNIDSSLQSDRSMPFKANMIKGAPLAHPRSEIPDQDTTLLKPAWSHQGHPDTNGHQHSVEQPLDKGNTMKYTHMGSERHPPSRQ